MLSVRFSCLGVKAKVLEILGFNSDVYNNILSTCNLIFQNVQSSTFCVIC